MKEFFKNNWLIWIVILIIIFLGFSFSNKSQAYSLGCSEYGMAYEDYGGYCKCMSGYVMGESLGQPYCVSGSSLCYDKYGYGSEYDSLSSSCECSYGYVFGKDSIGRTQCISENQACQNQYGYNARSTYGGKCECGYGYVFNDSNKCEYGNTVCSRKYGLYSSYNSLSNKCECDSGYTFDDSSQCVKKQNNVYFTVKELDTDNKKAIIKSDYDYSYYLITYNSGCYSSSFRRYLNHQIVVNLGTDFYLDTWDKIVLQDDNETCDITHKEKVDSNFTLENVENTNYYYVPTPTPTAVVAPVQPVYIPPAPIKKTETKKEVKNVIESITSTTTFDSTKNSSTSTEISADNKSIIKKITNFFKKIFGL